LEEGEEDWESGEGKRRESDRPHTTLKKGEILFIHRERKRVKNSMASVEE